MGIKYSFVDNAIYGTEDINDIARCLTGAGITPFLSKDSYSTSDLNSVTAALVSDGASLDGCRCSVQNAGTADMCINVAQGIIFFESGVRLIVDSDGYSVLVGPNSSGYVFAHYSPSLQVADIKFAEELPDDGEYVTLSEVGVNGSLKDLRRFAESKVSTMGGSAPYKIPSDKCTSYGYGAETYDGVLPIFGKIDISGIDISKYKYLLYRYTGYSYNNTVSHFEKSTELNNLPNEEAFIYGTHMVGVRTKVAMQGSNLVFYLAQDVNEKNYNYFKTYFDQAIPYFTLV